MGIGHSFKQISGEVAERGQPLEETMGWREEEHGTIHWEGGPLRKGHVG